LGGFFFKGTHVVRISPDVGRNRVVIQLAGSPSAEMVAEAERELHEALSRLRSPVDVLSDIRELNAMNETLVEGFKQIGGILGKFGVRRVVRVVGKSAQAAVHMERLSRQLKNHAAHLAFSMEEAEQVFGK
jgi:hypothetical protein